MGETESHKKAKTKAAGKKGETEVQLSGNRRLDALTASGKRATEIERSGDAAKLEKAARRLKASEAPQKVLKVPQTDMDVAVAAMRAIGVSGNVENLSGTKSKKIRISKK
ncbi:hypothetical protein [Desulfobacca acetoxidans]|uniref:Response regulator receiver protein n=1 Tax=Desulfobacca acetoxidans (strain ATCC 700848 / DSM 11109 / ASRB2) TaxID=880072 RepID=F2NG91_DESAR|nr:hypothetical protein [Desulfobacca acetoxidans]AEB08504.1 response regulator receiver protein [Desulfobacca acetoxidans DSM 11109]